MHHAVKKFENQSTFLADRTNGRAYASVASVCPSVRLSVRLSVVCDVMYCG